MRCLQGSYRIQYVVKILMRVLNLRFNVEIDEPKKIAGDHTIFNRPPQLHGLKVQRADPLEMCAAHQAGLTETLKV